VFVDWLADGYSDVVLGHIERALASPDLDMVCFVAGLEAEDFPVPRRHLPLAYADRTNIDADFSGVDCPSLAQSTFRGHVVLAKTGS